MVLDRLDEIEFESINRITTFCNLFNAVEHLIGNM